MTYPVILREREQNDHEAHQCWFAGDNYLGLLLGARRTLRDPGRAQLLLHRTSYNRPSPDADELCRRRAQDRATMCSGRLLLLGSSTADGKEICILFDNR